MALYLLDTDAVVDYINQVAKSVQFVRALIASNDLICTCETVLAEVYSGLGPDEVRREPLEFLDSLLFLPGSLDIAVQAGKWRYMYARQGRPLATTDVLIASTAYHHAAEVVTANLRDFPMPEISVLPLPR